jgi:tetratricopeptide (TPR) repeat protein
MHGEGALVALDGGGEERWRWAPGVQRVSAPAVGGDVICVTADARTLIVLDLATGEEQARVELEANASLSAPALVAGVAYVPCRAPNLLAVGLDDGTRWRFTAQDGPDTWLDKTPVVVGEHLFTVLTTGAVLALRVAEGSLAWRVDVGPAGKPLSPPPTDGERLFVGARDGLHALSLAHGRELWVFPTERRITAAPAVSGGVVYAACHDHRLYALDEATGRELWRYEAERRIEASPALAACGEPPRPCVLVADRGGTLTAVARPLSAADHEAAGHWVEAASIYADLGQLARGAQLLEDHGEPLKAAELWEAAGKRERAAAQYEAAEHWAEAAAAYAAVGQLTRGAQLLEDHDEPLKAAELWKAAGERERAAVQYETAGAWQQAVELWAGLGRPLRQAEVLEARAQSLEEGPCSEEERAEAWAAAAEAFDAEGERERAIACQQEAARCLRQPVITLDVQLDKGLVLRAWSRLQFVVRNEGHGPARNLTVRASGDEFEGQVMRTRQITTLWAGRESIERLDIRPLEYGETVPLRVSVEYQDQAGELQSRDHTVYIAVARTEATRGTGETIGILGSGKGAEQQRERELASLRRQLEEAEKNLRLIEERKTQYVLEVDVPLQLIKEERSLRERVGELERELNGLETRRPPLPATTHVLSFDRLSPADFERLCLWLVEREGYTRAEHLGLAGSEQGRDVVAHRPTPRGEELWYFQCKRYRSINAKTLKDEVDKYLQLAQDKPHLRPAGVVFVISCAVSAKVREAVGAYCEQHGLAHEFWGLTELDMRVKQHPDVLQEFFNPAP